MWTPITSPEQLPKRGDIEQTWLDFKTKHEPERFELAKDVAAMANGTGGTLLVGAAGGTTLSKYLTLTRKEAKSVARDYEEATRDHLRPTPIISPTPIPHGDGVVLALNVQPFPGQAIGVHVKKPETERENLFQYPVRVGSQTRFLSPEQLPMFMDPKIRRVAIVLEQAKGAKLEIRVPFTGQLITHTGTMKSVDVASNTLEIGYLDSGPDVQVPLDFVEGVCKWHSGRWQVYVRGFFIKEKSTYFVPSM